MDKKRIVTCVLAVSLAAGYLGGPIAYATDDQRVLSQNEKIEILQDKNILIGKKFNKDASDSLSLNDKITRSEITKLVVYTIGREELARKLDGATKPFPDVELSYWANGFISAAATTDIQKGQYRLVIGNEDGMFMPDQEINYGELATMLLRAVKPNLNETGMIYPKDYVEAAEREGIFKGISKVTVNKPVVRSEAFEMVYNAYSKLGTVPKTYTDNIGIVRKVTGWGILANQTIKFDDDNSTSYRVNNEFKVTSGAQWDKVERDKVDDVVKYGILAKYVLDDKNQVSHLVELGNELNGALAKDRFNTLFKLTANGTAFETDDYEGTNSNVSVYDTFKIVGDGLRVELVSNNSSNVDVELTDNTRVYILQGNKVYNLRTENDKKNNLPKLDPTKTRVYGAFEKEDNKNNGVVLVFSDKVEKSEEDLIKDAENAIVAYRNNPTDENKKLAQAKINKVVDNTSEKTRLQNIFNEEVNIAAAKKAISDFRNDPTETKKKVAKEAIEKLSNTLSSTIRANLLKELDDIVVKPSIDNTKPESEKVEEARKALEEFEKDPTSSSKRIAAANAINALKNGPDRKEFYDRFQIPEAKYKASQSDNTEEDLLKLYEKAQSAIDEYKNDKKIGPEKAQVAINKLPEDSRKSLQEKLDAFKTQVKLFDEAFPLISAYGKEGLSNKDRIAAMIKAQEAMKKVKESNLLLELTNEFNKVSRPVTENDENLDRLISSLNDAVDYIGDKATKDKLIYEIIEAKKIFYEDEKLERYNSLQKQVNEFLLSQYKEKYKNYDQELASLSSEEKGKFKSDLENSKSTEEAGKIVQTAYLRNNGYAEIDGISDLTDDQKKAFKEEIATKTNEEDIKAIIDKAKSEASQTNSPVGNTETETPTTEEPSDGAITPIKIELEEGASLPSSFREITRDVMSLNNILKSFGRNNK